MSELKIKQFFQEQEAGNFLRLIVHFGPFTEILQAEDLKIRNMYCLF